MELKEYATEVDVEYVRRAVRTVGRCAVKLEGAAEKCIKVLLALIQTKVNYVVQEAVVVIKDIFRRYPNRYESIIAVLCSCLDTLDEPEAKASMIWIIGEYADRIDNAGEVSMLFKGGCMQNTSIRERGVGEVGEDDARRRAGRAHDTSPPKPKPNLHISCLPPSVTHFMMRRQECSCSS